MLEVNPRLYAEDAEKALLGSMLIDPSGSASAAAILRPADFWLERHQLIFAALVPLGDGADLLTLSSALEDAGNLERAGGEGYLASLFEAVPTAINVGEYAAIVRDRSLRRTLLHELAVIAGNAHNLAIPAERVLADAAKSVEPKADLGRGRKSWGDHLVDFLAWFDDQTIGEPERHPTYGIAALDDSFGGLWRGDVNTIAGEPGMGKTATLTHALAHWCETGQRHRVLVVSQEMTVKQLIARVTQSLLKMNLGRKALVDRRDQLAGRRGEVAAAIERLHQMPIDVVDTVVSPNQVGYYARRWRADVVFVDFLQFMDLEQQRGEREDQAVRRAMNTFKALAKPTERNPGCNVTVYSQFNSGQHEGFSKLLGGSAIAQVSDNIAYILRDPSDTNNERGIPYADEGDINTQAYYKRVKFQVIKARFNAGGEARALFVSAHQRFVSEAKKAGNDGG